VPSWLQREGTEKGKDLRYVSDDGKLELRMVGRKVIYPAPGQKKRVRLWQVYKGGKMLGEPHTDLQEGLDAVLALAPGRGAGKKRERAAKKAKRKRKAPPKSAAAAMAAALREATEAPPELAPKKRRATAATTKVYVPFQTWVEVEPGTWSWTSLPPHSQRGVPERTPPGPREGPILDWNRVADGAWEATSKGWRGDKYTVRRIDPGIFELWVAHGGQAKESQLDLLGFHGDQDGRVRGKAKSPTRFPSPLPAMLAGTRHAAEQDELYPESAEIQFRAWRDSIDYFPKFQPTDTELAVASRLAALRPVHRKDAEGLAAKVPPLWFVFHRDKAVKRGDMVAGFGVSRMIRLMADSRLRALGFDGLKQYVEQYGDSPQERWARGANFYMVIGETVPDTEPDDDGIPAWATADVEVGGAVTVIQCSDTKLDRPAPAWELYTGNVFRAQRQLAADLGYPVRILSAKYGVLRPEEIVEPYDLSIRDLTADQQKKWNRHVRDELDATNADEFYVLAGRDYVRPPKVKSEWWSAVLCQNVALDGTAKVILPLEGVGIGGQRRFAKQVRDGDTAVWRKEVNDAIERACSLEDRLPYDPMKFKRPAKLSWRKLSTRTFLPDQLDSPRMVAALNKRRRAWLTPEVRVFNAEENLWLAGRFVLVQIDTRSSGGTYEWEFVPHQGLGTVRPRAGTLNTTTEPAAKAEVERVYANLNTEEGKIKLAVSRAEERKKKHRAAEARREAKRAEKRKSAPSLISVMGQLDDDDDPDLIPPIVAGPNTIDGVEQTITIPAVEPEGRKTRLDYVREDGFRFRLAAEPGGKWTAYVERFPLDYPVRFMFPGPPFKPEDVPGAKVVTNDWSDAAKQLKWWWERPWQAMPPAPRLGSPQDAIPALIEAAIQVHMDAPGGWMAGKFKPKSRREAKERAVGHLVSWYNHVASLEEPRVDLGYVFLAKTWLSDNYPGLFALEDRSWEDERSPIVEARERLLERFRWLDLNGAFDDDPAWKDTLVVWLRRAKYVERGQEIGQSAQGVLDEVRRATSVLDKRIRALKGK